MFVVMPVGGCVALRYGLVEKKSHCRLFILLNRFLSLSINKNQLVFRVAEIENCELKCNLTSARCDKLPIITLPVYYTGGILNIER